jgi:CHAT domain-containing protein/tetratricopeptide (TPR) repeat protein
MWLSRLLPLSVLALCPSLAACQWNGESIAQPRQSVAASERALALLDKTKDHRFEFTACQGLAAEPVQAPQASDAAGEASRLTTLGNAYFLTGDFAKAVSAFEPAVELYRKLGDWTAEAVTLSSLGKCAQSLKQAGQAETYWRQAAAVFGAHQAFAPQIDALENVAVSLLQRGSTTDAAATLEEILKIRETAGLPNGAMEDLKALVSALIDLGDRERVLRRGEQLALRCHDAADETCEQALHQLLGGLQVSGGDLQAAIPHLKAAVDYCDVHPAAECSTDLRQQLGGALVKSGYLQEALPYLEKALAMCRTSADWPCQGNVLAAMGVAYERLEDYQKAAPAFEQSVEALRRLNQPVYVSTQLANLALVRERLGNLDGAMDAAEESYALDPKGSADPLSSTLDEITHTLADLRQKGRFGSRQALAGRVLALDEKVLPADSWRLMPALMNAADRSASSDFAALERNQLRALEIARAQHTDAGALFTAHALGGLSSLYTNWGDLGKAESYAGQAVELAKTLKQPADMDEANFKQLLGEIYNECSDVYVARHDLRRAVELLQETRALLEGTDSSILAHALSQIATLFLLDNDDAGALPYVRQAIQVQEKATGTDHPNLGILHGYLGRIYQVQGKSAEAEAEYLEAVGILRKSLGPEHPETFKVLGNFAGFYARQKQFAKAEALIRGAIAASEKVGGRNNPVTGLGYCNLVAVELAQGRAADAVQAARRCQETEDYNLPAIFSGGTEEQKRQYLESILIDTFSIVTLHTAYAANDPAAADLALTTILRRKGLTLDAEADQMRILRSRMQAEDRELLDGLLRVRSRIAALSNQKPEPPAADLPAEKANSAAESRAREFRDLSDQDDRLQRQISARSSMAASWIENVSLRSVQAAVPKGSALVEIYAYPPIGFQSGDAKPWRYAAYVVRGEGGPAYFDLGEKSAIDDLVVRFRNALGSPPDGQSRGALHLGQGNAEQLAGELGARILPPIEARLHGETHLLISPDGELNLLPFGALKDAKGEFALRRFTITYVSSGRDLMRLGQTPRPREAPLIVAGPDYDRAAKAPPKTEGTKTRAAECGSTAWRPLAGALAEGQEIFELLALRPERLLEGEKATKSAILAASAPGILHIATHGFFCEDAPDQAGRPPAEHSTDPLTRSGLVFAGANQPDAAAGDSGILTALEAASLDLWGTQLIVLSACDTAVGQVQNGEGVFGLRRALVLAGAASQVLTLWRVDDATTRYVMAEYYRRLKGGEGRSEALRAAQLALLDDTANKSWQNPYYWAAFIPSGDWAPIPAAVWNRQ